MFFTGKLYIFLSISHRLVCWYYYFSKYNDTIYLKIMEKEKTVLWKNASKEKRDFVPKKGFYHSILLMSLCCNDEGGAFSLLYYYNATLFYTSAASSQETDPLLNYTRLPYYFLPLLTIWCLWLWLFIWLYFPSCLADAYTKAHTHPTHFFPFEHLSSSMWNHDGSYVHKFIIFHFCYTQRHIRDTDRKEITFPKIIIK